MNTEEQLMRAINKKLWLKQLNNLRSPEFLTGNISNQFSAIGREFSNNRILSNLFSRLSKVEDVRNQTKFFEMLLYFTVFPSDYQTKNQFGHLMDFVLFSFCIQILIFAHVDNQKISWLIGKMTCQGYGTIMMDFKQLISLPFWIKVYTQSKDVFRYVTLFYRFRSD